MEKIKNMSPDSKNKFRNLESGLGKAFTLVELIVVITILAILGTIAFISLQGYSRDARDSTRTADLGNMKTSLELYSLKTGNYPKPDNFSTITYSGGAVWYQGIVGDQVTTNLKSLNEKPLDPLTKSPYTYSVTQSKGEYEVLALYEGSVAYTSPQPSPLRGAGVASIFPQANAATTTLTPKVVGNYNGVYVTTTAYIVPTPSIITAELLLSGNPLALTPINIRSQVITNGTNIPKNNLSSAQTGSLTGFNLAVFTGSITKNSPKAKKVEAITQIQNAYTGATTLNTQENIAYILNQTSTGQIVALTDITILKGHSSLNTSVVVNTAPPAITDWRSKDPNCSLPDVKIGTQFWAGCNSTLGTGTEWGKKDDGTNGTIVGCYDYNGYDSVNGTGTQICNIGDPKMASNAKANAWYTGTNANGDSAVNNIWGKLYTWASLDTNTDNVINSSDTNLVCSIGYHIPSDTEWTMAEEYLFEQNGGAINCDAGLNGWINCVGVGWMNYSTNSTTSIVSKLGIPLSGYRNTGGAIFGNRGNNADLWSSTPNASNAYYRSFYWGHPTVYRYNNFSKFYGFSVRCIKD